MLLQDYPPAAGSHRRGKPGDVPRRGICAFIAPDGVTPLVSGNSIVVVGDSSVLVIDTGQFPSMARHQISEIRRLTPKPVRYIVNTHWHPDHWLGNGEYQKAFPAAVILSTTHTRDEMRGRAMRFITPKSAADTRDAVVKMVDAGKRADGTPYSEIEKQYYGAALTQFRTYVTELEQTGITLPTLLFRDEIVLSLGGREAEVKFLGRGNTGGDAVVYLPDTKTLITGDLLVYPFPYGIGSFIGEWIDTMQRLATIDAVAIIPGHGAVQRDGQYIGVVTELLQRLQTQVRAAVADSLSLPDTRKLVDLGRYRSRLCGENPWCQFGFDRNFVRPAVGRAYREAKEGKLRDEGSGP
ncbi:MAG TPA: MBL fold metallo-hydrolase [Gemmatimonadales bacterium]